MFQSFHELVLIASRQYVFRNSIHKLAVIWKLTGILKVHGVYKVKIYRT